VLIGESPAGEEVKEGLPFVGKSGKLLNSALRSAGIDRSKVRLMNLVPVRAPGDKFAKHDPVDIAWGKDLFRSELSRLSNTRIYVPLGSNPTQWIFGGTLPTNKREGKGFIEQWRGSVIPSLVPATFDFPENYIITKLPRGDGPELNNGVIVPTFHPSAVLRQFTWHPWFMMDIKRAASILTNGADAMKLQSRRWYWQDPNALRRLAASGIDLISIDTEMEPAIVAIATEDEVHVFEWSESFREPLTQLLTSNRILKVAHNWTHDYAWIRKKFGITVARPIFDTQGAAHILNTALEKSLSPHISTRYTNWPYHKWLVNHDPLLYCGMDAVVSLDAYWPQVQELMNRGLMPIAEHDHKLLTPLMEMQAVGFRVNESARADVEKELTAKLDKQDAELQQMVAPIIAKKVGKFEKPHLFRVDRQCECCGGGKLQQQYCMLCTLGETFPITPEEAKARGFKSMKAFKESFIPCRNCVAGKVIKNLPFNSDSPDQLADVLYRGLGIRARKFKGKETTKAANLEGIKNKPLIVDKIIEVSESRAELDTVSRLRSDSSGLLHCVFDPFGTTSGRVAGKEGLVEVGTNPMNIPLEARRLVVPRDGYTFLYPDMAQIEARVAAVLSKDKNLLAAFNEPIDWPGNPRHGTIDSHTKVMQLLAAKGVIITRDQSKRFTYAGIFGGGAQQLAVELNAEAFRKGEGNATLTTEQVQRALDTFFNVFSGLRKWQQEVADEVLRTRKLRNPLTGREFTWTGYIIDQKTKELKHEIAKQVWSRLPQDTAAYVLALGLIDIRYNTDYWGTLLQPLIHVHDAPLIEVPIDQVEFAKVEAKRLLTKTLWGITFEVEMKQGDNWYAASGGE